MKVTVCQFRNGEAALNEDWQKLVEHVGQARADLVLLPEMPFSPWFAAVRPFDDDVWNGAVTAHNQWLERLAELAPACVLSTQPANHGERRLNRGFVWNAADGLKAVHDKTYLPDEDAFWEASWYHRGDVAFQPFQAAGESVGMMICTEMWFTEQARFMGRNGISLLVCPRATLMGSTEKWVAGGRTAAVVSGAWCLGSNRGGVDERGLEWGGNGWIIEPEEGEVLARTSVEQPFITMDISLDAARKAKKSYPRYVLE